MLDIKIYKPVRPGALVLAGVKTPAEFARWFAATIAIEAGVPVTGTAEADGDVFLVHLHTDEANLQAVGTRLDVRGLSFLC